MGGTGEGREAKPLSSGCLRHPAVLISSQQGTWSSWVLPHFLAGLRCFVVLETLLSCEPVAEWLAIVIAEMWLCLFTLPSTFPPQERDVRALVAKAQITFCFSFMYKASNKWSGFPSRIFPF